VIYNLPLNTNIILIPIRQNDNTPIGTFVVNTGQAQNPTLPNHPAGPPYTACATQVTLKRAGAPRIFTSLLAGSCWVMDPPRREQLKYEVVEVGGRPCLLNILKVRSKDFCLGAVALLTLLIAFIGYTSFKSPEPTGHLPPLGSRR
jgi:hypothetical protein